MTQLLALNWIEEGWSLATPFNVGGVGIIDLATPFDVEGPLVDIGLITPFNVIGQNTWTLATPFDVEGDMVWTLATPFDVLDVVLTPSIGSGGSNTVWLTAAAAAGATIVTVNDPTGMAAGKVLRIGLATEYREIVSVTGNDVAFTEPLVDSYAAGTPVGVSTATTTAPITAGDTTVEVSDPVTVGSVIQVGDESREVVAVDGSTATLSAPLNVSYTSGTGVFTVAAAPANATPTQMAGFVSGLLIFDKGGRFLGNIPAGHFEITAAPSRSLNEAGSMAFRMARADDGVANPHANLLFDDRLVLVMDELGTEPWVGSMTVQNWTGGEVNVTVLDATALWRGPNIEIKETVSEQVGAGAMYQKVIDLMNVQRAADGEVVWAADISSSEQFFGDAVMEGDAYTLFDLIAKRSMTEYGWRASYTGGRVALTFVARDQFTAGGFAVNDGLTGNTAAGPRFVVDPTSIVNAVRVRGRATNLTSSKAECSTSPSINCLDWMADASGMTTSTQLVPEGYASVDPGPRKRREEMVINLDWGMSAPDQQAAASQVEAQAYALYHSFLRAWHDRYGRPFWGRDGWQYDGPPSDLERFLTTGLGWRTHLQLVEYQGQPASAVMRSEMQQQLLIVLYDMRTDTKTVRRVWYNETGGTVTVTKMSINGTAKIWSVVGGVITGYRWTAFSSSHALVGPPITYWWPAHTNENGDAVPDSYKTLRRVVSITEDGAVTEAMYFDSDPAVIGGGEYGEPYKFFVPHTIDSGVVADDYIGRVYDFETRSICDWDPRRDGIGGILNVPTVRLNAVTTGPRWHFIPWGDGDGTTQISMGISETETKVYVANAFVLPQTYPYVATIGDGLNSEDVQVTAGEGTMLTIVRGYNGTTAIIHPTGTSFTRKEECDDEPEQDEDDDTTYVPWPEGTAWAQRVLAKLQNPIHRLTVQVTNDNNEWAKVQYGGLLSVNIQTEGPAGGITGTYRLLGWAPNYHEGTMELLVEEWLG